MADLDLVGAFEDAFKEGCSHLLARIMHHYTGQVLDHVVLVRVAEGKILGQEFSEVVQDSVPKDPHLLFHILIGACMLAATAMNAFLGVVHLLEDHIDQKLNFVKREQL